MPTLFLSANYSWDSVRLKKAAEAQGWPVQRLRNWRVPEGCRPEEFVIYGEPMFAAIVAQGLQHKLITPPLNWLATLSAGFLNRQVRCLTAAEARQMKERAFFKPAGDKSFPAGVLNSGAELPEHLPADEVLLVSEVVAWPVEFRCFIRDRQCLTLSPYARDGQLCQRESGEWYASETEWAEAKDFIESLLQDNMVSVPEMVVIDIGIIAGKGWSVIEANEAYASGLYGCDPAEILAVLLTKRR